MKFMEKAKRFFTLNAAKHEGFTLVELIVVIAILAILAGVAVPAYSGYIEKSKEAADQTLLVAVNKAFASACLQNGVDPISLGDGSVSITLGNGIVTDVSEYEDEFFVYYEGNEDSAFQVIKGLKFAGGVFVDNTGTVTHNGVEYAINLGSVDALKKAEVFYNNMPQMQGQVDNLSAAYGNLVGGMDAAALAGLGSDYVEKMEELDAIGDPTKLGNATVQYVADKTAGMTAQDAMDQLANAAYYMQAMQNQGQTPGLMDVLRAANSTGDPLSTAAMMYGAVTAYANGNPDDPAAAALKTQVEGVNDAASLLTLFQSAAGTQGFLDYCGSYTYNSTGVTGTTPTTQFTTDMNGYLGALDTINNVSGGVDIGEAGVWSSINVQEILGQLG